MQKQNKPQLTPPVLGAIIVITIALSGCGQKDPSAGPAASPPATVVSPKSAVSVPTPAVSQGGMDPHQAALQAQSDYWRKHGQGLNEVPHTKSKQ